MKETTKIWDSVDVQSATFCTQSELGGIHVKFSGRIAEEIQKGGEEVGMSTNSAADCRRQ